MSFKIHQLEDAARDVDSDIRYMALEDFHKQLTSASFHARNVHQFVPTLLNLLEDRATEVQNQAVRVFVPLVRHLSDKDVLFVVSSLLGLAKASKSDSKFATSTPNLALRGVLSTAGPYFSSTLSRDIVVSLLTQLMPPAGPSIDDIEILIELVLWLGPAFTYTEIAHVCRYMVDTACTISGIVRKRAVSALDAALAQVILVLDSTPTQHESLATELVDRVKTRLFASNARDFQHVCLMLLQSIVGSLRAANVELPAVIYDNVGLCIYRALDMSEIVEDPNVEGLTEDLDIDELIARNSLRADALSTMATVAACASYEQLIPEVKNIVSIFVAYNPLGSSVASDLEGDEESLVEFSDDEEIEQFEDASDNDALAAQLRQHAIRFLRTVIQRDSVLLPPLILEVDGFRPFASVVSALADTSDQVVNEAIAAVSEGISAAFAGSRPVQRTRANSDVSMLDERSLAAVLETSYLAEIEQTVLSTLLTPKRLPSLSNTAILVETMVVNMSLELSPSFLEGLHSRFLELSVSYSSFSEVIAIYRVLLQNYTLDSIPPQLLEYMIDDLVLALQATTLHYTLVKDVITTCQVLSKTLGICAKYEGPVNQSIFPGITDKLVSKIYSSEVRQHALSALADLVVNNALTTANLEASVQFFADNLKHEVSVKNTIENLIKTCSLKSSFLSSADLTRLIVERLSSFLSSSDTSLHMSSLHLLECIFKNQNYSADEVTSRMLGHNLFGVAKNTNDAAFVSKAFTVLAHLVTCVPADLHFFENVIEIVNTNVPDEKSSLPLEHLIRQMVKHSLTTAAEFFQLGISNLKLPLFVSAMVLAVVASEGHLDSRVTEAEKELVEFQTTGDFQVEKFVFDIHFLGRASAGTREHLDRFLAILKHNENDSIRLAAARAFGLCTVKDTTTFLPDLLSLYNDVNNLRFFILLALKQVLLTVSDIPDILPYRRIWLRLIDELKTKLDRLTHGQVAELRLAGEILSIVSELDIETDYQAAVLDLLCDESTNEQIVYVCVAITKRLLGHPSANFNIWLIVEALKYLPQPNLELKQAIVSTLLTGVFNKLVQLGDILADVILPRIYEELTAKEEFKKVIPMGPYKYVVDEGLEVRKLSYELISSIVKVANEKDSRFLVDHAAVFEKLSATGLNDTENDIINLTVANLIHILQEHDDVLRKVSNQQDLVASLTKLSSKKLRSKALPQETESYEATLQSVIRLSKAINQSLYNNNITSAEWTTYYHELKNKHHLLFAAVEL